MEKKTKKKLIIIASVLAGVFLLGAIFLNFAVDKMFSRVTEQIGNSDMLEEKNGQSDAKFNSEDLKEIESQVSSKDKIAVLALLAKALPPEEYSRLMSYVSDGVSEQEIKEAYNIMRKHLTPEQKKQIKDYYFKYMYLIQE